MTNEHRVFIGLGSNLGDSIGLLQTAINGLPGVVAVSPLYETEPQGGPENQPEFLNCVVELHTTLQPLELLGVAQRLEQEAERVRLVMNGPRTLDVDILLYDNDVTNEADLIVPHPRMWERNFVIEPLRDIAPDMVPESADTTGAGGIRRSTKRLSLPKG